MATATRSVQREPARQFIGPSRSVSAVSKSSLSGTCCRFRIDESFYFICCLGLSSRRLPLPYYDLTFAHTKPGEGYKRRMQRDTYNDFSQLPNGESGPIVYFGGNNYLPPLLKKVTSHIHCEKVIFFASANPPNDAQWRTIRFDRNFYNWHYACARDFIAGRLSITGPRDIKS